MEEAVYSSRTKEEAGARSRKRPADSSMTDVFDSLNKNSTGDLRIVRFHPLSGPVNGGTDILVFCTKVTNDDIKVCFKEEGSSWTVEVDIGPEDIHHMYGVAFHTPPYKDQNIKNDRAVQFHLNRPSDGGVSESVTFTYTASALNVPTLCDDTNCSDEGFNPNTGRSFETESPPQMTNKSAAPARAAPGTANMSVILDTSPGSAMAQRNIEGRPQPAPAPQALVNRLQQLGFVILLPSAAQGSVDLYSSQAGMQGIMSEGSPEGSLELPSELLQQFERETDSPSGQSEEVEPTRDTSPEFPEAQD